ncbi:Leucine-rich repeat-containing protein 67 [Echinococcus granulosus]|uniref:Leucine-rich repeat-containing protein 67 n=1 Tax=Echinococcus granulosus TaxID=6210 RepID=W6UB30_ECHGR|nr:Leucine-rich repeat-containing protein 67 [Echinococcus granulosus]EUB58300.1 Leucine-rich repeat-containing protein 67 [Echinococcus granulosus]
MVKVSRNILIKSTSPYSKRRIDEPLEKYLGRLTHLYMNNKDIDDVGEALRSCTSLRVLYLYENHLTKIPDMSMSPNLTHLYLQQNDITRIHNLDALFNLEKLYLDLSASGVNNLQGLECLQYLERLDVGFNQLSEESEVLTFLSKMSRLSELNISENPIMKNTKINDKIIVATKALGT